MAEDEDLATVIGQAEDAVCKALASGNESEAATALRKLHQLGEPNGALELIADLLEDNPALRGLYPYRLQLKQRRKGTPPKDPLQKRARQFHLVLAVLDELKNAAVDIENKQILGVPVPKHGKPQISAAVYAVSKRHDTSETTVYEALDSFGL